MPRFRYRASGAGGGLCEGQLEATSRQEATRALTQRGLMVLELREERAAPADRPTGAPQPAPAATAMGRGRRLDGQEAAIFFRQLALLFNSGIPLHRAMDCLVRQAERPRVKGPLVVLSAQLSQGSTLSGAMAQSGLFSPLQVGVVKAGEDSGMLSVLLERLARLEEMELAFRQQVKARLSYPVGVAIAMLLAAALLTVVMGGVISAMGSLAQSSPLLRLVQQPWLPALLLLGPAALLAGLGWAWRQPTLRPALEGWLLGFALVGPLLRRAESARLCRILAVLANSGLRVDRSLTLAAGTTSSPRARAALELASQQLTAGEGLSAALAASAYFPPEVIHMTAAGEASGRLGAMLAKVAEYSDMQVTRFLEAAVTALEPLLLSLMGLLVGLTMLATFGPLYGALDRL